MSIDTFGSYAVGLTAPAVHGATVTPHDTNELATLPRALMATTTAGVVTVVMAGGETIPIYLALGNPVAVRAKIVKATGAVAAGIVALW